MKTITEQKPIEEIQDLLEQDRKVYIIGCGTCATMCHTGGVAEVLEMKKQLEEAGKEVVGWMVIPTACDDLTGDALRENTEVIDLEKRSDNNTVSQFKIDNNTINRINLLKENIKKNKNDIESYIELGNIFFDNVVFI